MTCLEAKIDDVPQCVKKNQRLIALRLAGIDKKLVHEAFLSCDTGR